MASTRTTTRTIRITNETADYFREKPLNRAVESLYGLLTSGKMKFDGDELKIECTHQNEEKTSSGVPQNGKNVCTPKTDLSEIEAMANLMSVPTERLLSDFRQLLEEGTLYYSDNRLINPRYEDFERLCEAKKQDPDKMISNVVRQMGG